MGDRYSTAALDGYKQRVLEELRRLKRIERMEELVTARIPIGSDEGFLVPVCELMAQDADLIERLAQWRAKNMAAYPTQFTVTIAGTAAWLRSLVLDVPDRMMFLVVNPSGRAIGHVGIADAINDNQALRIDNVARGVPDVQPGLMTAAMRTLLVWARDVIRPAMIYAVVFSENDRILRLLERLGFTREAVIPLRRYVDGDRIAYRRPAADDAAEPDKFHLELVYRPISQPPSVQ
jgi:perosamine synthetase